MTAYRFVLILQNGRMIEIMAKSPALDFESFRTIGGRDFWLIPTMDGKEQFFIFDEIVAIMAQGSGVLAPAPGGLAGMAGSA